MQERPLPKDATGRERMLREGGQSLLHDLKNCLQLIRGHLAVADEVDARGRSALGEALDHCGVLQARLESLLTGSSQPARHLRRQPLELAAFLRREAAHFEVLGRARPGGQKLIHLELKLEAQESIWVRADPHALHNIFNNLLINAWDALSDGDRIVVSVDSGAEECSFTLADTGPGMSPQILARASERAFTTKGAGGSGLGLHNVQGLCRQMGGRLQLRSEPGAGLEARVFLPTFDRRPATAPEALEAEILVVEDHPGLREILGEMLDISGWSVQASPGIRGAREILERTPVKALLLDEHLGDGLGEEFAIEVRQRWPDVAILRLSGEAGPIHGPADAIATKPVGLPELRDHLELALHSAKKRLSHPPRTDV